MRPPVPHPRLAAAALSLAACLVGQQVRAEPAPVPPSVQPTVPLPPPQPPARPEELKSAQPAMAEPAPLPPVRPAELSPPGETPLPPPRPPELSHDGGAVPDAPLPPARPPDLSPGPAVIPDAPLPPARPAELTPPAPDDAPLPPARPPELSGDGARTLTVAPLEDAACLRSLDGLGVRYARAAPILNGQCSVANPLTVSALGGGIAIGAPDTMVCPLAEGLARWTADVQRAAEAVLGDALKGLTLGGTYVCRGQNHGQEAQLSEHAFANAVDVMGFTFGKHAPIAVGPLPEGSKEAAFLAAVRTKACDHFTTVLGPGADEQHANHLHLDERVRKAGIRLCQ